MRNFALFFALLWIGAPAASMASECELVPLDRKDWQAEAVITQKYADADAVFIGTVINTEIKTEEEQTQCTAKIAPSEVFKGSPGIELLITQYDNRDSGANKNKCTRDWLQKDKGYLFYVSRFEGSSKSPIWYFAFCTLDSYLLVESASKEIAIVKMRSGK